MNNVAICVNENVVIVTVFNAEQILNETVASQTLNKICYCCLPVEPKYLFIYVF